jgi:hypothetical protein
VGPVVSVPRGSLCIGKWYRKVRQKSKGQSSVKGVAARVTAAASTRTCASRSWRRARSPCHRPRAAIRRRGDRSNTSTALISCGLSRSGNPSSWTEAGPVGLRPGRCRRTPVRRRRAQGRSGRMPLSSPQGVTTRKGVALRHATGSPITISIVFDG